MCKVLTAKVRTNVDLEMSQYKRLCLACANGHHSETSHEPCACVCHPVLTNPRYRNEPLKCYDCGGNCSDGYETRYERDSDGGYAETTFHCSACLLDGFQMPKSGECGTLSEAA